MLTSFSGRLKALRTPVRSLLYLYWIYAFTNGLTTAFVQIAVFQMFSSLYTNIVGTMLAFTGIMVGFCVFGYFVSHYRLDAKQGFYYSFFSFAAGLLLLSQATTLLGAYGAMFIYGLGSGFFWLTVHTYELTETYDTERDFYSSVLSGGMKLISIIAPLCATAIIWISLYVLHISAFGLLFVIAPLFYLLGFFCFKGIQAYRPERIELADVTHFFLEKRNRIAQIYMAGGGFQHMLAHAIMPLTLFYILETEISVGIYSTIVGCFSIVLILVLGQYRNRGNRIFLFGLAATGISLLLIFLGLELTLLALIFFTVGNAILNPIMQVSDHVVALQTMESIGRSKKDFYATMILRDFSLWVWRMVAGGALLILSFLYNKSPQEILSLGLFLLAVAIFFTFIGAKLLVQKMNLVDKVSEKTD
jgi:MFS family permease